MAHPHRTHRAEIPDRCVVRTLGVGELVRELWDHEIEVGITLAVGMRGLIDRHAIDVSLEVGAVIEIVAAHQILVRFALTAVQGDDQTRHGFQQLTGPVLRSQLKFLIVDDPFARR